MCFFFEFGHFQSDFCWPQKGRLGPSSRSHCLGRNSCSGGTAEVEDFGGKVTGGMKCMGNFVEKLKLLLLLLWLCFLCVVVGGARWVAVFCFNHIEVLLGLFSLAWFVRFSRKACWLNRVNASSDWWLVFLVVVCVWSLLFGVRGDGVCCWKACASSPIAIKRLLMPGVLFLFLPSTRLWFQLCFEFDRTKDWRRLPSLRICCRWLKPSLYWIRFLPFSWNFSERGNPKSDRRAPKWHQIGFLLL